MGFLLEKRKLFDIFKKFGKKPHKKSFNIFVILYNFVF